MQSLRETLNSCFEPIHSDWLIAFADLTRFARWCEGRADEEIVSFLSEFYQAADAIVDDAGGLLVKVMGDALLLVFPRERVDVGVQALLRLQQTADAFCLSRQFPGRLIVKAHYGEAILARLGGGANPPWDIIGRAVNTAAMLPSNGFALTPESFRKLETDTRKLFKKHTPALRYIPLNEKHR